MAPGIIVPVFESVSFNHQEEGLPALLLKTVVCIAVEGNPLPFAVGYCSVGNFQEAVSSGVSPLSAVNRRKAASSRSSTPCLTVSMRSLPPTECRFGGGFTLASSPRVFAPRYSPHPPRGTHRDGGNRGNRGNRPRIGRVWRACGKGVLSRGFRLGERHSRGTLVWSRL